MAKKVSAHAPDDELQRLEAKLRGAIGLRPGQAIDEVLLAHLLKALQCEGWARAIAKQPLPPRADGVRQPFRLDYPHSLDGRNDA